MHPDPVFLKRESEMLASASPSFVISKIKTSNIFFIVNFDYARSLNLRLMRTLGVERSSEKICYVLIPLFTNILALKKLLQIKTVMSVPVHTTNLRP